MEVVDHIFHSVLTGKDLMEIVVGAGDVKVDELKRITQYEGFDTDEPVVGWFWEILTEMSASQRIAFLQFSTARSRLPIFSHQSQLTVGEEEEGMHVSLLIYIVFIK